MALRKVGIELVAAQAAQFVADINKADKATDQLGDTLGRTADTGSAKLGGLQKAAGSAGAVLGGAAVAGVAALTAAAVGLGAALLDTSDRVRTMRQALGDLGTEELQEIDQAARLLESRFGADLPGQLDATRVAMANFGLTSAEAMDVLTAGFSEGLNVSDDFLDTITEYSVNFAHLGFSADESLGILNRGLEAGARNSDVVADAVKEFGILINEAGTATGLQHIDTELANLVTGFQEGEISGTQAFDAIIARLAAIEDPVAQQAAGVELFGTKFEDMGAQAILALGGVQEGVITSAGATEEAGARIESLGELFSRTGSIIGTALIPVNEILLDFANKNMPAFQKATTTAIDAVTSAFGAIAGPVNSALGAIENALEGGIAPAGKWATAFEAARDTVTSAIEATQKVVDAVLGVIQAFWKENGESIKTFTDQTWDQIAGIITSVMQIIQATIVPALDAIATFITNNQSEIVAILTGAWNNIQTVITTTLGVIQGVVNTVLAVLQGDWSAAWTEIQNLSATFVQGILDIITNTLNTILAVFGTSLSTLQSNVSSAFGQIAETITGFVNDAVDSVTRALDAMLRVFGSSLSDLHSDVARALGDIVSTIAGFASDAASAAQGIASALIDGMVGGIRSGASQVASAARDAAESAFRAAKSALGISSPSTVFAEVGENIDLGLAAGILDNIDVAVVAAEELGESVMDTVTDLTGQITDAVNTAFESVAQGTADFARGQGSAARGLRQLLGDTDEIEELQAEHDAMVMETARLHREGLIDQDEYRARVEEAYAIFDQLTELEAQQAAALAAADAIAALREETAQLAETDPEAAARLFDLRSKAILEVAQLEQDIAEETNDLRRSLLEEELVYVQQAQAQELTILQRELETRQAEILAGIESAQSAALQLGETLTPAGTTVANPDFDPSLPILEQGGILPYFDIPPDPAMMQLAQALQAQLGLLGQSVTTYNYSPTYAGDAPAASQDFNVMRTMAG